VTEEKQTDNPTLTPAALPAPIRLVASARFYGETRLVPPGVAARDLHGFLEGEVEELSLFPLEATAWGYLDNGHKASGDSVLLYAAFREHINGATDPEQARRYAVLPGFAALLGHQWKKTSWVVLLEPECVSLVRIQARAAAPDFVRSRYGTRLDENPETAWALREELLADAPRADDDKVESGLIRCAAPAIDRNGAVRFPLECQPRPEAAWKRYGTGERVSRSVLLAADVRERQFLSEERSRRRAVRQLRGFLRFATLVLLLLAVFQYQYLKRTRETAALAAQAKAQRSDVEALREQEALARSAARLSEPPLEIFDWLMAVNEFRPSTVAFYTAYADRTGNLGFSGEAPSVLVVNQYRDMLQKTGRYSAIDVKEISSAKQGVKFTIQVQKSPDTAQAKDAP
jgi:hypothetical protein